MLTIFKNCKPFKIYFCLLLSLLFVLTACDSADSAEKTDALQMVKSSIPPSKADGLHGKLKVAPLYDGEVVGDDSGALWWVSRQLPFAVNAKAAELSPLIDPAPASINDDLARAAFAGKLPAMPQHLEIPYAYASGLMKAVYEQYQLAPEHPSALSWTIADSDGPKGMLEMEEFGGLITKITVHATMSRNAKLSDAELERYNRTPIQVLFSGLDVSLKSNEEVKELMDRCYVPLLSAGDGASKSTVKHGKRFTFTRQPSQETDKLTFRLVIEPRVK